MDICSAKNFIYDQIPPTYQSHIPPVLKNAYGAVDLLYKQEPILNVISAKQNKGRLISFAVDLGIEKLIETGQWPFDYNWKSFASPTGRFLEVRLPHSVMTVSQISDPKRQPRNVVFRNNRRLNNQPFFDLPEFEDEKNISGLPHFILCHGYQNLNFAHIGLPHGIHNRGWIYKTENLMSLLHVVDDNVTPVEQTDFEDTMTLKEEIERWQRDNG